MGTHDDIVPKIPERDVGRVNGTAENRDLPKEGRMLPRLPIDATSVDQRKRTLRAQFSVQPLPPEEFWRQEDARWASEDPDVLALYGGEFVVPYRRKIVAHGTDAAVVLAEAARVTGRQAEELPLVGVIGPLLEIPHR